VELSLEIDDAHPMWQQAPTGVFWFETLGGVALSASLGSGAEASCDTLRCDGSLALGMLAGARLGYALPIGLSLELSGGYLQLDKTLTRHHDDSFARRDGAPVALSYVLRDELRIAGGFAALGVGYRLPIAGALGLHLHAMLGGAFVSARDYVGGTASSNGTVAPVDVEMSGSGSFGLSLLVAPEVTLAARFEQLHLGIGVMVPMLLIDGPSGELGDTYVRGGCDPATDGASVACAPGESFLSGETLYGPLLIFLPMAHIGYHFE
jgi:hypothetical protein